MTERLVRKVARAAVEQREWDEEGWIKVDVPGTSDKEICLAIMEANKRGLVQARGVTSLESEYVDWRLMGPTEATQQYLRDTRTSKRVWGAVLAFFKG